MGSALWFYWHGQDNLAYLLITLGGLASAFAGVKFYEQPTEFEQRQLMALKEIEHILRERGVE